MKLASVFHAKALLLVNGRKNTWASLSAIKTSSSERIWFHCSSLGEFEQARPLIEALKAKQTDLFIALSFFSPSGYEFRKNYPLADVVFYLPADTQKNANRLIALLKPTTVFWIKYDFWYFILSEIHQQHISNYLVSSIFRKEQLFFSSFGAFFREQLTFFKTIFVQDDNSKTLLANVGINSIVAGDTRFDRVVAIAAEHKKIDTIEPFCDSKKIMIAGSTWNTDIDKLREALPANFFETHRLIIIPHDVHETNLNYIEKKFSGKTARYSNYNAANAAQVLIVDCTGLLSSIYRYGSFAYIGGGFGVSVHNILEAAVYGIPTIFGPNHKKAKEASDLIKINGSIGVTNSNELKDAISVLMNERERELFAAVSKNYVAENIGATEKILRYTKLG